MRIQIPPAVLKAHLKIAPAKDIRFYLNGVSLEVTADGGVFVASTDGKTLLASRVPSGAVEDPAPGSWIIPRDSLALVDLGSKTDIEVRIVDREIELISFGGNSIRTKAVDGEFPYWRRAIPTGTPSGAGGQFDPDVFAKFAFVAKTLGHKGEFPFFWCNGAAATMVTFGSGEHVGVAMPLRAIPDNQFAVPDWVNGGQS